MVDFVRPLPTAMENLACFSFVLRPFSLRLAGLCVLVGVMDNGDHEVVILSGATDGEQKALRREVSQVVSLDEVIYQAEIDAKDMGPNPTLPVVWIRTQDRNAWGSELGVLKQAVNVALRSVKSAGIRDLLARTEFVDANVVTSPTPSITDKLAAGAGK